MEGRGAIILRLVKQTTHDITRTSSVLQHRSCCVCLFVVAIYTECWDTVAGLMIMAMMMMLKAMIVMLITAIGGVNIQP